MQPSSRGRRALGCAVRNRHDESDVYGLVMERKAMHFCTIFATFWPWCRGRLGCGEGNLLHRGTFMARVLNEILLFSCIAAFVTGIVLAAASLLT